MKYKFILTYQPTESESTTTRTCFPLHGDDLAVSIDREEGEWYYTRNLDGKLVFVNADYAWIMACEFDGTFTLDIKESHDGGATYYDYFSGTFSRASLEIDEDNHTATLNGLKEGIADLIKNGAKEDYDLMKLIPDSEAKTVQGQVPPALALIDNLSSKTDLYCGSPIVAAGYKKEYVTEWNNTAIVSSDSRWNFLGIYVEAKVEMDDPQSPLNGVYCGFINYQYIRDPNNASEGMRVPSGSIQNSNGCTLNITAQVDYVYLYPKIELYNSSHQLVVYKWYRGFQDDPHVFSPQSLVYTDNLQPNPGATAFNSATIYFHYIRAALLTMTPQLASPNYETNVLDTGGYYTGMRNFEGSGLTVTITPRTTEHPNGHRLVPGSADNGGIPQYFAPPDDSGEWIALAEDNWNYASMWYKITPSIPNGLLDPARVGAFSWAQCWNIGTCIRYLLNRITNGQVVFAETTDYSQFLYGNPNPVQDHEPFQWLVTQKSNVMRGTAESAARCPVRLEWFFELLRNAFNCYYWFEKRNDGKYDFRVEHVEYFRRGGAYNRDLADQLDLTVLKPRRNFLRNGQPAKRYADKTNKYTFDLDGMVEKHTYSWQGDGGSDDFKGNPMYFRAGWIEKGTSEDHQVDNIFADLGWLMLNAGTDTESSKNYDGLFIFGGYNPYGATTWMYPSVSGSWKENGEAQGQYLVLATTTSFNIACDIWLTIPAGETVIVKYERVENPMSIFIQSLVGTGHPQQISINERRSFDTDHRLIVQLPNDYSDVTIHRIHARSGNVFNVPNVADLLRPNNNLQNGVLAWPWLQCEYLHYDIPAAKWTYLKDEYTDNPDLVWESDGTIKMVKKQTLGVVPVPDASTEDSIMGIMGVKTGLGIGIIDNAKINLSSRNAEMTIIYDINPQNN